MKYLNTDLFQWWTGYIRTKEVPRGGETLRETRGGGCTAARAHRVYRAQTERASKAELTKMEEDEAIQSRIRSAMLSRVEHFREKADSVTHEGARRLLEKDLGLETRALDVHRKFIKQLLEKYMNDNDDGDNALTDSGEVVEKNGPAEGKATESPEKHQVEKNVKEPNSKDEEKMEDSPVMGLITGNKLIEAELVENEGTERNKVPTEGKIKKAIWNRASYVIANSETITMAGFRRLLEEDLELEKSTLDPFKKFISKELDEVLTSPKVSKSASDVEKKRTVKSQSKNSKTISSEGSYNSSDGKSDEVEDEVKSKKKVSAKDKLQKSEGLKKRKRPVKDTKKSNNKKNKISESTAEAESDAEDGGRVSEDDQSQSSAQKPARKKEVSTAAYGKRVEHLKSIIKSCGMSVAPSVYKKAKQVPDNKREAFIIKELEDVLSREGLSTNPTEKEIKEVKKRKERAKELEGIDMSNIVASSRRRSTASFVPPPKPETPVKKDEAEDEDENSDGDDDEDDDDNDDGDDGQSEEVGGDDEDSD